MYPLEGVRVSTFFRSHHGLLVAWEGQMTVLLSLWMTTELIYELVVAYMDKRSTHIMVWTPFWTFVIHDG